MSHQTHPIRWPILLAGAAAVCTLAANATARQNIRDAFFAEYPIAVGTALDTLPSQTVHCGVCHYDFLGGGPRNPYGLAVGNALPGFPNNQNGKRQAIRSIQTLDADGDGFSALVEITDLAGYANTPTFPGLTPANVGSVSNVALADIQSRLVPSAGVDLTPPAVTVLTPNGWELLTGNAGATVQWTATDASGIARVDLLLSDDGGASFAPLAENIGNAGTYNFFLPNRPTLQALIRIEATDNAFNVGSDQSDAAFTVVAASGGIAPTTLRDFDQPGTQPFETTALNAPSDCAACHANFDPQVEPYRNWQGSMMAQAARDPLFEACMAIANQDAPDSGDLCLRCHLPSGWLRGRSVPTDGTAMLPSDYSGVSCDLCHRMVDPIYSAGVNPAQDAGILADLSNPPTDFGNGMFVIDPSGLRRGPFADATSGHAIAVSPFHREAAFCGTCHDVSNPAFVPDGSGNYVPNAFDAPASSFGPHALLPVERTYSEWLHSAYNSPGGVYAPQFGGNLDFVASCQDCHMRDVTGKGCNLPEAPTRADLPLHDMTGGSTWLPNLIPLLFPGDPEVSAAALADGAQRARYMLQNAASLAAAQVGDDLQVTVTNESGHKLPTGYPEGRRMWLNVRFVDSEGQVVAESAAYDAATGVLDHGADARIYEAKPGLDSLTAPLVGVPEGPSFHFVLNNKVFKDTRIPPRGFTNAGFASFGGAPVGAVYADGQYWDEVAYEVPAGAVAAEVRLYYQSTSKEYVEFLRDENTTNSAGDVLYDLWVNNGRCPPELMASLTLPVTPPEPASGDLDGDGDVDLDDLLMVLGGFGLIGGPGDADGDGDTDLDDLLVVLGAFGT